MSKTPKGNLADTWFKLEPCTNCKTTDYLTLYSEEDDPAWCFVQCDACGYASGGATGVACYNDWNEQCRRCNDTFDEMINGQARGTDSTFEYECECGESFSDSEVIRTCPECGRPLERI